MHFRIVMRENLSNWFFSKEFPPPPKPTFCFRWEKVLHNSTTWSFPFIFYDLANMSPEKIVVKMAPRIGDILVFGGVHLGHWRILIFPLLRFPPRRFGGVQCHLFWKWPGMRHFARLSSIGIHLLHVWMGDLFHCQRLAGPKKRPFMGKMSTLEMISSCTNLYQTCCGVPCNCRNHMC